MNTETMQGDTVERAQTGAESIDAVGLHNRLMRTEDPGMKQGYLDVLNPQEIDALAQLTADKQDFQGIYDMLKVYNFKTEIAQHPKVTEAVKEHLTKGEGHPYDIDRILGIPGGEEILADSEVRQGMSERFAQLLAASSEEEHKHLLPHMAKMNFTPDELKNMAESMKGNTVAFQSFVGHFGSKTIYPES